MRSRQTEQRRPYEVNSVVISCQYLLPVFCISNKPQALTIIRASSSLHEAQGGLMKSGMTSPPPEEGGNGQRQAEGYLNENYNNSFLEIIIITFL